MFGFDAKFQYMHLIRGKSHNMFPRCYQKAEILTGNTDVINQV